MQNVHDWMGTPDLQVKTCAEKPKDWDWYVGPLLFAYREVKQESLGFSPFDLLYKRTVRGPMSIMRELMINETA